MTELLFFKIGCIRESHFYDANFDTNKSLFCEKKCLSLKVALEIFRGEGALKNLFIFFTVAFIVLKHIKKSLYWMRSLQDVTPYHRSYGGLTLFSKSPHSCSSPFLPILTSSTAFSHPPPSLPFPPQGEYIQQFNDINCDFKINLDVPARQGLKKGNHRNWTNS